jgi:hypothetical protein
MTSGCRMIILSISFGILVERLRVDQDRATGPQVDEAADVFLALFRSTESWRRSLRLLGCSVGSGPSGGEDLARPVRCFIRQTFSWRRWP